MNYNNPGLYVHYGCSGNAPKNWINFDVTPIIKMRKIPFLYFIITTFLRRKDYFPKNVLWGNIIKGLPIEENSCKAVYCCHVLEHLTLHDFRKALSNTHKILQKGGIFKLVVPDLEFFAREYINKIDNGDTNANYAFMSNTYLGHEKHEKRIREFFKMFYFTSYHFWMWDKLSLTKELENAGFCNIKIVGFGESEDKMFQYVEEANRFENAVSIECIKT